MPVRPISPDALTELGSGRYSADPSVVSAIRSASAETGTRFDVLLASAAIESGLNPVAKAPTSSATGLFQFIDQTWLASVKRFGAEHGLGAEAAAVVRRDGQLTVDDPALRRHILDLRKDPKVAAAIAGDHLRDLTASLTAGLGRTPDVTETYLAHFLGPAGASQMLRALADTPTRPASEILPDAARANPSLFQGQTVAQFVQKVQGRVERTYADLDLAMPNGPLQFSNATAVPAAGRTGKAKADAPEAQASGWGSSLPSRISTAPERMMLASLAEVFTRVDRAIGADNGGRGRGGPSLPGNMVSQLRADAKAGASGSDLASRT